MRDLATIAEALRTVLPARPAIESVAPLTTGFSNDTYLVNGPDLILRLPPAAGAMLDGHGVVTQARIYAALANTAAAPPVPAIVHIEESPDLLGVPFFVMARVAGEAVSDIDMQPWFVDASAAVRTGMCRDQISSYASLARLGPLGVLGAPVSAEDDMRVWQNFAARARCAQLVEVIERLLKLPAPVSGPPALTHGDSKLSNLMWRDYRITAMLDWEMAQNADPLADLGYMLYQFESDYHAAARAAKLPGMLKRDEVIALWESVSGRSAAGVFWHETAQMAKLAAIIAEGANMFNTGRSTDPKLAIFKASLDYYLATVQAMLAGIGA